MANTIFKNYLPTEKPENRQNQISTQHSSNDKH
jgi:hypothetical protein